MGYLAIGDELLVPILEQGTTTLQEKTASAATTVQNITPDSGYGGLSKVVINAATKQDKTVTPTTLSQTITADSGYYGLGTVTVNAATKQAKTASASTSQQTISPDSGYYGLSSVTINAATKQNKTVTPSKTQQTVNADSGYYGLDTVTVNAVTNTIDSNIQAGNIKKDVTILGVTGTLVSGDVSAAYCMGTSVVSVASLTSTGIKVSVPVTGNYKVSWIAIRNTSSGTSSTRIYVDGVARDSERTTWTNTYTQYVEIDSLSLTAGQEVEVYARARSTSYKCTVGNLIIEKIS